MRWVIFLVVALVSGADADTLFSLATVIFSKVKHGRVCKVSENTPVGVIETIVWLFGYWLSDHQTSQVGVV
jgi:hypothetical protein